MRGIGCCGLRLAKVVQRLHSGFAKQIAAASQFLIQSLQHAQAELAFAFDGNHARVRQLVFRVRLELDTLLEVDQVKLQLRRASSAGRRS